MLGVTGGDAFLPDGACGLFARDLKWAGLFSVQTGSSRNRRGAQAILARPIPRWTVYVSKLLVVVVLTVAASAILLGGLLLAGTVMGHFNSAVRLGFPVPFAGIFQIAEMTGLAFFALTIQHWVSLRWRAFFVAIGFGIVATVAIVAMLLAAGQYGSWPQYYPWALPMLMRQPHNASVLYISAVIGIVVSVAGCVDFSRRDVT